MCASMTRSIKDVAEAERFGLVPHDPRVEPTAGSTKSIEAAFVEKKRWPAV